MEVLKQDIINLVSELPEKINVEEFMYKLYVLDKIKKGQKDVLEGNCISVEGLFREIERW